jgi:hypothetical protein
MNLLTFWLQLTLQLHAFQSIMNYRIPSSCSCDWSINVIATFYNYTCLTMPIMMWKGIKRQSMNACPFFSRNAQTLESIMATSKSTESWSLVSIVYLVWSNFGFFWCEYDYGTSSNTFIYAPTYLDGFR